MSFYQKNRDLLVSLFPGISDKLNNPSLDSPPALVVETVETKDGQISIRREKGTWLHSTHSPLREASRLIQNSIPGTCPFCIFYGFGLAYHLDIFISRHRGVPFAVVEPDVALFNYCLGLRDFSSVFQSPGFSLALGAPAEAMPALLEGKPYKDIQICMLRSVVENNREYFKLCDRTVQEYFSRKEINANTLNKFSRLWVSNICRNLPLTVRIPGVWTLKERFKGIPALLLAAGPTLEETLPLLPELRKRMLLVCVDTALKACLRRGIEPDFLILTDPQYWNSRHMDRCRTRKTILISDVSTYPAPLWAFEGRVFFCSTPFPLGQFFESRTEIKGKLKSGGSVSTAAWDFIRHCGGREIYCAGLDLSFPDGETHYRGSTFEERIHGFSERTSPVETGSWLALMGGNPYQGKNHLGEPVLTDQRMKIYIHWFEEQMACFSDVRTQQLSPRSIALKGLGWEDSERLLSLPEIRETKINKKLDDLSNITSGVTEEDLKNSHSQLITELEDLIALTAKGSRISKNLLESGITPGDLDELNQIDQAILNRESREMAGFILAPILEEQIGGTRTDSTEKEVLTRSLKLYTELNTSLVFHRDQIIRIDL
ncbi:6-hydroxymethylpterin diphosphokinase MptE-like protein [Oceanispirochaeta sp.]|jgi:hypothetical protein|uniref:motility associated factor glycosyltransferase family protein n=1 Tax=Oceanispirochaeta sp. TaxID=2035350 RepID=UPI0026289FA7|nr:6-hydroxymethylpterin diphosphokinase MptE-like protein [Oceanispirochaeta sp.]MDA3957680.1 DUF115 domain-containing protein [Oceanispirochaeta sp.]